jgi:hypothetical protein
LPPRRLEQAIWPFVDEWLASFDDADADAAAVDDKPEGS